MEKPIIIFLDIDGVMAPIQKALCPAKQAYFPDAVRELNRLCEKAGAEIVITSSRLRLHPADIFLKGMREAGFTGAFHTPPSIPRSLQPFCRGQDIEKFMACQDPPLALDTVVIIDNSANGYSKQQISRLVKPNAHKGLSERTCEEALKKLGLENRFDLLPSERSR